MPDWLIWVIIAAVIMSCSGGCGYGVRRHRRLSGEGATERDRERPTLGRRERASLASGPAETMLSEGAGPKRERVPLNETPLQVLQRRFVDGSLTLEQYEAELDKLEGLR